MSARKELIDHILGLGFSICNERCGNCNCAEEDAAEANALIDALLREHAKELAEKLRTEMGPKGMIPGESDRVQRYVNGWHGAADFIDPEVTA
ncbi:hypothetical protein ACFWFX_18690 [Streptomyces roseolus]|uniref:hypothetical protein n=1 Tax=Streptomyces roseolus TaxID=67358 RepID=UPI0036604555